MTMVTESYREMLRLKGNWTVSEEPFTEAIFEEREMSREQGGTPVEMLYKLDEAKLIFAIYEYPSHTALSAMGFRPMSRLLMNALVHSCMVLLNMNSNSQTILAGLSQSMVLYVEVKLSHPSKRTRHPKGSGPAYKCFKPF